MNDLELRALSDEIGKYRKLYYEMCDKYYNCDGCDVKIFMDQYDNNSLPCMAVFMAAYLLGFNKNTSDFLKQQYKNKDKMCDSMIKCDDCDMHAIRYINDNKNLSCFEVYIASILLKNV